MANKTEHLKLSELTKLPNNPRTIKDDQFKVLVESIQANPDYFEARPIICSNRMGKLIILAGNQRYEAAKFLKLKEVPVYVMEGLTEEREFEIIIRDNISNGSWDFDILANEFDNYELESWGLDIPNFDSTSPTDEEADKELETKLTITCNNGREAADLFEEMLNRGFKCELKG